MLYLISSPYTANTDTEMLNVINIFKFIVSFTCSCTRHVHCSECPLLKITTNIPQKKAKKFKRNQNTISYLAQMLLKQGTARKMRKQLMTALWDRLRTLFSVLYNTLQKATITYSLPTQTKRICSQTTISFCLNTNNY